MSIVGPRPLLVKYLPWYTEAERHRHDVRPGLTGYSQVHGRNSLPWKERFAYDTEYVKNISLINDIKIIFLTVKKVFVHENIQLNVLEDFDEQQKAEVAITDSKIKE